MTGQTLRFGRLTSDSGAWLMAALDHGVSMGPLAGLADPRPAMAAIAQGGATCFTVHKGLVPLAAVHARTVGILLHLSASTAAAPDPDDKRLVATVEEAVRLGCDGVSIHVNVGCATEARQLEDAGCISASCAQWGMPLVAMMYPRGPNVAQPASTDLVAHAARLGAELGADAVKVPYAPAFRDVVLGCPVPVLVAGGVKRPLPALLAEFKMARKAGAAGASVGRNLFQQANPAAAMAQVAKVFR